MEFKEMFDPHTFLDVTIPHAAFIKVMDRIELLAAAKDKREDPCCIALTGPSGAGKTFTLDSLYRKNSAYDTPEGTVRPWIKVTAPSVPTLKNLAAAILTVLDPGDPCRKSTESQITNRITRLLEECQTDVIWIDDFQHLYDRQNERFFFEASNWLKNLIEIKKNNNTKRMLIVSGLDDAMKVIEHNTQLRRRFRAKLALPCFSWSDEEQRNEFSGCLCGFLEHLKSHFTLQNLDSASFFFRCYCATGGLIGYLKRVLQEVVLYAYVCKKSAIGMKDFDLAYDLYLCSSPELQNIDYRPFSEEFYPTPTDQLLALARLVGTPPDRPVPMVRKRAPRTTGTSFVEAGLATAGSSATT
jgi:hypothetical protein